MTKPEFVDKFKDVKTEEFLLSKDSASNDNEIDVHSGATITTTAVLKAVNAGIGFLIENAEDIGGAASE